MRNQTWKSGMPFAGDSVLTNLILIPLRLVLMLGLLGVQSQSEVVRIDSKTSGINLPTLTDVLKRS